MTILEIRRRSAPIAEDFAVALHPVLRRVYAGRGLMRDADLDLSLRHLLPVGLLDGVANASRLLAMHRTGRVLVIGDFDADGATSSALVVRALRAMRFAHVDFLVPNRFQFGYGLTPGIVALAAARQPSLIVTVDNGVSSIDGVASANALDIPVLITDHHLPGAVLPPAAAIVNPNLDDSTFPSRALAGVGVAFYLMAALAREIGAADFRPAEMLDLVALGTIADMVPLDRNNRILVSQGLRRIRAGRCVAGMRALLESAGRTLEQATAADMGFAVAPRLNAAGRLTDMSVGIACLLTDDAVEASRLAAQLSQLNEERRDIERRMQVEAVDVAAGLRFNAEGNESVGLCLFDEGWHQGVVGLVAGRIKDRLHRPVIAFARADEGLLRGSARSIPGVHIRDALDSIASRHPGLIDKFGGHAMAAGMTLRADCLDRFREAFAAEIALRADAEALTGVLHSDGELTGADLCVATARLLRDAGPWGQGFPEPVFDGDFDILDARVVGTKHLKLQLRAVANDARADSLCPIDAIAFGYVGGPTEHPSVRVGAQLKVAYRLEVNEYRGQETVQLNCQHLKPA